MSVLLRLLLLVCLMVPTMPDAHAHAQADANPQASITADADPPPCHEGAATPAPSGLDVSPEPGHDCCEPEGTSATHDCGCGCGCGGLASTGLPAQAAGGSVGSRSQDRGAPPPGGRAPLHPAPPVRPPIG